MFNFTRFLCVIFKLKLKKNLNLKMDEKKTEEIPTTNDEQQKTKNKVRFSEVAQKVLESNKEKKKYDLEKLNTIDILPASVSRLST